MYLLDLKTLFFIKSFFLFGQKRKEDFGLLYKSLMPFGFTSSSTWGDTPFAPFVLGNCSTWGNPKTAMAPQDRTGSPSALEPSAFCYNSIAPESEFDTI
ncbi:MAG: hypothetical protein D6728_15885 [Cyanobacteria bacterium J055]|nr:MAG: hypothetical protein D6728_15885 [Cyanobacteria bacterium J055]